MSSMVEALNRAAVAWWDWTLTSTGQGALLLLVVGAILFAGKTMRPGFRYGLLLVVLLKFAAPPVFGVAYGFSDLLARAWSNDPAPTLSTSLPVSVEVSAAPVSTPHAVADVPIAPQAPALSRLAWLLVCETAGVAIILALIFRQWTIARQLVKRSAQGDSALEKRFHTMARAVRLWRTPRLCLSDEASAPQSGGIFRPFVLLPTWAATMPDEELDILLAHELAHVRRMDAMVNGLQAAAQALLWWNPAVWWLNRRIREEREFCCDDLVLSQGIASGVAYSRTLVNVAERVSLPHSTWAMAGMADNFSAIDRRVRRALDDGHGQKGWGRYGALAVLILVAGWTLPGATEDEVQSGAGAVVSSGDKGVLKASGLRPTWPIVTYSFEEFRDWNSGLSLSAGDDSAAPGKVLLGLRAIQVDRHATLVLPDGRNLAAWLSEAGRSRIGTATQQDWTPFVERAQTLRESGEAEFTHLSHAATGKGGEVHIAVPTAIDAEKGASTAVEFLALHVGVRPNRTVQDDGNSVVELALSIDQTVVAKPEGVKRKYEQVTTSEELRVDIADTAPWIYLVSDTRGSTVNIICIRPALEGAIIRDKALHRLANESVEGRDDDLRKVVATKESLEQEIVSPGFTIGNMSFKSATSASSSETIFEEVQFTLQSVPSGAEIMIRAKELKHATRSVDGQTQSVLEGDLVASFSEFSIRAMRLEFSSAYSLIFYDATLENTAFGTVQAEQVRVDPVARWFDILNGTVDEARLKAALGEDAKNAARGEWLSLPFEVKSQIGVEAIIVDVDGDLDVEFPLGTVRSMAPMVAVADVKPKYWDEFKTIIDQLVKSGDANLVGAPTIVTLDGEIGGIEITNVVTLQRDGEKIEHNIGFSLEVTPTLRAHENGARFMEILTKYTRRLLSEESEVVTPEPLAAKFTVEPVDSGSWSLQFLERDDGRVDIIMIRFNLIAAGNVQ